MEGAPQAEQTPTKKEMLNDWDREMLEKGLTNVIEKMYKDFGNRLPDVILLPDTAARPLYYALDSGFSAIIENKNLSKPQFHFFKTTTASEWLARAEAAAEKTIDTSTELINFYLTDIFYGDPNNADPNMQDLILRNAQPERVKQARDAMSERFHEILELSDKQLGHKAQIAIVDDVYCQGRTLEELHRALDGYETHNYAVVGWASDDAPVFVGHDVTDDETTSPGMGTRFSWSGTEAVGVVKKENPTNKYAVRIDKSMPDERLHLANEKAQLRKEMRTIGEKVSEKVLEDINQNNSV